MKILQAMTNRDFKKSVRLIIPNIDLYLNFLGNTSFTCGL